VSSNQSSNSAVFVWWTVPMAHANGTFLLISTIGSPNLLEKLLDRCLFCIRSTHPACGSRIWLASFIRMSQTTSGYLQIQIQQNQPRPRELRTKQSDTYRTYGSRQEAIVRNWSARFGILGEPPTQSIDYSPFHRHCSPSTFVNFWLVMSTERQWTKQTDYGLQ
jgi:hypothetical protein